MLLRRPKLKKREDQADERLALAFGGPHLLCIVLVGTECLCAYGRRYLTAFRTRLHVLDYITPLSMVDVDGFVTSGPSAARCLVRSRGKEVDNGPCTGLRCSCTL